MRTRIMSLQVKSQQYYLKEFGYYVGSIDGVWRDTCREAMRLFQQDLRYKPATKATDTPFIPFEVLPKGFTWELIDGQRGILLETTLPRNFALEKLINAITEAELQPN